MWKVWKSPQTANFRSKRSKKQSTSTGGGTCLLFVILPRPGSEGQHAILPAEAEAVHERGSHFHAAGLVGHVVEVAFGVVVAVVDGWGHDTVVDGLYAGEGRHGAGRAERVAYHALIGGDSYFIGAVAHGALDGVGFGDVVEGGGRAVGADVVDVIRGEAAVLHGACHGEGRARAAGGRSGQVVGVARNGSAEHLGVDRGSAGQGAL